MLIDSGSNILKKGFLRDIFNEERFFHTFALPGILLLDLTLSATCFMTFQRLPRSWSATTCRKQQRIYCDQHTMPGDKSKLVH